MNGRELPAAVREQTQGNLRLASQFIREFLDAPERFEALPSQATIVFLPPEGSGDDELRRANMAMAKQLEAQGKHPILVTVGQSEGTPIQAPPALAHGA